MTQNGRKQTMTTAKDCDTLRLITKDISDGMAFVVSNWGKNTEFQVVEWLAKERCSGACNVDAVQTIKNIKIKVGTIISSGGGRSSYDPSKYQFEGICAHKGDDLCASQNCPSTEQCKWSYP